jgi:GNAT superfamily N-acetyltransferase
MLNIVALSSPARDPGDLERRARGIVERARGAGDPWFLVVSDGWLPGGDPAAAEILTGLGFQPAVAMMGMATDALAPPRREAPRLELRRVSDAETRAAVADLNAGCYGIPSPVCRDTIGHASVWSDVAFGRVGYLDGRPVCCAATFIVEGTRYAGFVATAAEHRRKGYGELVMRSSLADAEEATGIRRTVLHATDVGRPVYEAMGYHPVTRFVFYAPPAG